MQLKNDPRSASDLFKSILDAHPSRELAYRALLWGSIGLLLSYIHLFSLPHSEAEEKLSLYVKNLGSWPSVVVLALLIAVFVYVARGIEYKILSTNAPTRIMKHVVGAISKVSTDVCLGVFGAGAAILATFLQIPFNYSGSIKDWLIVFLAVCFLLAAMTCSGLGFAVSKLGPDAKPYRWQQDTWWGAFVLVPLLAAGWYLYLAHAI